MAPLPAKPDMKDRILETADRLFYLQGIRAIGVDTIAAEIGISKRTLYNHFPSKDALISAYLARRFVAPRASDKPPVEQILGTFDSLERRFSAKDFRGCPFVNAVAELGEDRSVRKVAVAFKESRRLWFRDLLVQLASPMRNPWRRSSRCWSTVRSRRISSATIRRWHGRQSKRRRCC